MLKRFLALRYIKNHALRALLISDGLVLTAEAMLAPIYAVFVTRIGGDILDAGITAAALAFGAGIASVISGRHVDTLKSKRMVIVYGYAVSGVAFLLYTQVNSVWQLAVVQLIVGLIRPLYGPAFDALYSVHLDKKREAEEWGAWEAVSYFTAGVGAIIGGALVALFNFDALFVGMAVLCFASALYVIKLPKRTLG
jgi:predicted MFS family arabinose efflux permease